MAGFEFAKTIPGCKHFESERKMRGFPNRDTKGSLESVFVRRTCGHGGIRFRNSGLIVKDQSGRLAEPALPGKPTG
jgi:hypothetical protein